MGNCRSTTAVSVAVTVAVTAVSDLKNTAKLILPDGQLEEFSSSVKVSEVWSVKQLSFPCFICDSDEFEFDGIVSAMESDQFLLPGQLYFALPLSWQGRPLQAGEIAALAYKASLVLGIDNNNNNNNNNSSKRVVTDNSWLTSSSEHHRRRRTEVSRRAGTQGSRVDKKLTIIPEETE